MSARDDILASIRENQPQATRSLPDVPLFDAPRPAPLLSAFKESLERMGGLFLDPPAAGDVLAPVRTKIAAAKVVCSTVPEIAGNRDIGVGLAQHLIVLLDPADIVVNIHHAYRRPEFRSRRYASFHTGPSATADIEGVLIHGAQGVRSLSVLPVPRGRAPATQ